MRYRLAGAAVIMVACGSRARSPAEATLGVYCSACTTPGSSNVYATGTTVLVRGDWAAQCDRANIIAPGSPTEDCNEVPHEKTIACGHPGCVTEPTNVGFHVTLTQPGVYPIKVTFTPKQGSPVVREESLTAMTATDARTTCELQRSGPDAIVGVTLVAGNVALAAVLPEVHVRGQACAANGTVSGRGEVWRCPIDKDAKQLEVAIKGAGITTTKTVDCTTP